MEEITFELEAASTASSGSPLPAIISLAVAVLVVIGTWKMFTKAGKPGWACIIPFYSLIVMLEIAQKPLWWFVMIVFVPFANIVFLFMMAIAVAEKFGKGTGFGVGLVLLSPIFAMILGFGSAEYQAAPAVEAPAA